MKKTSLDLLKEIMELGFEKEYALDGIDVALDDEFGYENRKELSNEYLNDELYDSILDSFICEKEAREEMSKF